MGYQTPEDIFGRAGRENAQQLAGTELRDRLEGKELQERQLCCYFDKAMEGEGAEQSIRLGAES